MASADECLAEIERIIGDYKALVTRLKKKGSFPRKPSERDAVSLPRVLTGGPRDLLRPR